MQLLALKEALQGKPLQYAPNFFSGAAGKVAAVIEWAQRTGKDTTASLEPLIMVDAEAAALVAAIPMPIQLVPNLRPPLLRMRGRGKIGSR